MVEILTFSVMFLLFALRVPIAFSVAWVAVT
jgi:hypothetical protein